LEISQNTQNIVLDW